MSKGVVIPLSYQAKNIDALVINAINAEKDIDNGIMLTKGALSTASNETEVYKVDVPAADATGLFMAYSPEDNIIVTEDGNQYKVGDLNPKNFTNVKGLVFNAIKLEAGDKILASVDCFATVPTTGSKTATINTNGKYVAATATTATGTMLNILREDYISIPEAFGTHRTKAYVLEVAQN